MNKLNFGLYGKLPAHGDFIERGLPGQFVRTWDEWLQRVVSDSRDLLGEAWLDHYLTSPIWRFALGQGVIDKQNWIGALVPSVDSVGRYYPLTIAAPVDSGQDPFALLANNPAACEFLEQAAVSSLQEGLNADELWDQLSAAVPLIKSAPLSTAFFEQDQLLLSRHGEQQTATSGLLYGLARMSFASASYWYAGTEPISEFVTCRLPEAERFSSMLTGHWQ